MLLWKGLWPGAHVTALTSKLPVLVAVVFGAAPVDGAVTLMDAEMIGIAATVKLTVKLAEMPLLPDTVTVAVCVPTTRLEFGPTVKALVRVAPTAILEIVVVDTVNLPASVPESATFIAPVDWLPAFVTETDNAAGGEAPKLAGAKVCVPLGLSDTL